MKWWMARDMFFLRVSGKSLRRSRPSLDSIETRMQAYQEGDFSKIIRLYEAAVEKLVPRVFKPTSSEATLKRGWEYLKKGLLSKSVSALTSGGIANVQEPHIKA